MEIQSNSTESTSGFIDRGNGWEAAAPIRSSPLTFLWSGAYLWGDDCPSKSVRIYIPMTLFTAQWWVFAVATAKRLFDMRDASQAILSHR